MADLYEDHKLYIEDNSITRNNMVNNDPTQLAIASKLLPYFEIALINFGKKLYDCKIVDYHYKATGGKAGKIIIDFSDPNSAAHLFGTPITITSRNNRHESFQVLLEKFFSYIKSNNCDHSFTEPPRNINADGHIDIIESQLLILLNQLTLVSDINDKSLQNAIMIFNKTIENFKFLHPIETLTSNQQNRLSTIIATAKAELENANRADIIFKDLNSTEFKLKCFDILTKFQNQILTYQQLMDELGKTYKVCSIQDPKIIHIVQKIIDLNSFYNTDKQLRNGMFDNGFLEFKDCLKDPNNFSVFYGLDQQDIEEYIDIITTFYEFLDLNKNDLNNFINYIKNNYPSINTDSLTIIVNKSNDKDYENIINEILAVMAIKQLPLSHINNRENLHTLYLSNFHYFSRKITNNDEEQIVKIIKNNIPKNNYDIQFDQIVNSFNVVNDINFFISNDKSFKQESTIAKYYIIEKLQQKLLNKNLDFDILSFLFLPTNIQTAYMLTEYQLQLDKFAAGYESYQDFTHNNHITKDHNWLALYYKLLDSNEFMVFIQTEQLIPNFAKTARKITLITAMCNIGELDYEFEVGHPTNGKKDKDIYSLKFGKLQIFGNLPIQNGKQIILEIENTGHLYKVNSLKTDAPGGKKKINEMKMLRIVYVINEKALSLLKKLGLAPQSDTISPRRLESENQKNL